MLSTRKNRKILDSVAYCSPHCDIQLEWFKQRLNCLQCALTDLSDYFNLYTVVDLFIYISVSSLEILTIIEYVNPNNNVTIPDPKKQAWSTALITFQASGLSRDISNDTNEGKSFVILYWDLPLQNSNFQASVPPQM